MDRTATGAEAGSASASGAKAPLEAYAEILAVTAREAVEEMDAVCEHPEVIEVLRALAARLNALADDLEPFRHALMHDEPELVERLITVAAAVQSVVRVKES